MNPPTTTPALLLDGALGTELLRAGLRAGECFEHWNLTHPECVRAIHAAYVTAGADILTTNTFQANPAALARHGLRGRLTEIVQAGIQLAREAGGPERLVLLSVGPLTTGATADELEPILAAAEGADAVLLETWSSAGLEMARRAVEFLQPHGVPVLLSLTYHCPAGVPRLFDTGWTPEEVAQRAQDSGIAVLGANCGRDIPPGMMIDIVERYRNNCRLPLLVRPNAGTPTVEGVYPLTPEALAKAGKELLAAGVRLVGGCCGTTPEHIAALRKMVDEYEEEHRL